MSGWPGGEALWCQARVKFVGALTELAPTVKIGTGTSGEAKEFPEMPKKYQAQGRSFILSASLAWVSS